MLKGKHIWLFIALMVGQIFPVEAQELFQARGVETDFFSSAPVEDIHAVSKKGISVLNSGTGEISFSIDMRSFQFKKALMQEHFNEEFMESHKYPKASFKGNIRDYIDLSKDGEHEVMLQGTLEVHGKAKKRQVPAKLKVEDGRIGLYSKFDVACEDHEIKIPKILWKNIAEVVQVQVKANYSKLEK